MQISDADVSEALVVGLTETTTGTGAPIISEERFMAHYGADRGSELLARVIDILNEAMDVDIDWAGKTLIDGGNEIKEIMRLRYPFLSDRALALIGGYFMFRWR